MELHEFVRRTIEQVITGVKASHDHAVKNRASIALGSNLCEIEFDVAVTTIEAGEAKKGVGIFVAGFGLGATGKTGTTNTSESRIKFSVPVNLPEVSGID